MMGEVIAQRQFAPLYIVFDIGFLVLFALLLFYKKKYMTLLVGVLSGFLYMAVDYGIFHLVCGARTITPGYSLFWVLLWMSMSYGFTNFAWIWLWISKDRNLFEWSLLILVWWFCCPLLVKTFDRGEALITIQRTTGAYHGYMALILFVGYLGLIFWNLRQTKKEYRVGIPWLLAIGVLVQFGWEAGLLLGGIRSAELSSVGDKLAPLIVNSLLETNLGMPYVYLIFIAVSRRFTESFRPRQNPPSFVGRIAEHNRERVRDFSGDSPYLQ